MDTNLRKIRLHQGLTLQAVCDAVGTNPGWLSKIESGQKMPVPELAFKLADFYSVSLDVIYDRHEWSPSAEQVAA
jgi:transcriptional regulator with XRE-family HTH domain